MLPDGYRHRAAARETIRKRAAPPGRRDPRCLAQADTRWAGMLSSLEGVDDAEGAFNIAGEFTRVDCRRRTIGYVLAMMVTPGVVVYLIQLVV